MDKKRIGNKVEISGLDELFQIQERKENGITEVCINQLHTFHNHRYDSRFALPVYGSDGEVERYNVFHASLVVRHNENGKMYLYDIIDIKKETSNPLGS